jgi:geranylgeranyl pyrophosphate synthase
MQDPARTRNQQHETQPLRPVQENICQTRVERGRMRTLIQEYVAENNLVAPLSLEELRGHADRVIRLASGVGKYRDYLAVLVSNEVWRPHLAGIPMNRRLLLIPQCLRDEKKCRGTMDEFGLLCGHCGGCVIHELKDEAERLGYVVMVAEGSPVVMALIESGQVEAVLGVSCLSVLEQVFPYMEAAAVPGMAIPLLREGCENTALDLDWLWDALYAVGDEPSKRLDLEALRREVEDLFTGGLLDDTLGPVGGETESIARHWLAKSGKRWRPFLTACVYQALREDPRAALPQSLRKLMVAVECFHKASLIHDDIEDDDEIRYGEKTLHEQYGVPVALNTGDFLLGEGYRLIGELDAASRQKAGMLKIAAAGHRTLCEGQGAELCWLRRREPLSVKEVISIFRGKTAPAFEVALRMGAVLGGADERLGGVLHAYSEALGVAYQIRDDLSDSGFMQESGADRLEAIRPSLVLSMAYERAGAEARSVLERVWREGEAPEKHRQELVRIVKDLKVEEAARAMLKEYRSQALLGLVPLENGNLKSILHRVVWKIFNVSAKMGCCNDYQAGHAPHGGAGKASAG